jgi:phage virion morphogenesis protein
MTGVRVTLTGDDVSAAIRALARLGKSPEAPLKAIGIKLVASTRNRMIAEQTPDGMTWPRLNPLYAQGVRGGGILRRQGMRSGLMASLTSQAEGSTLRVGTNKPYSAVHQFGATITPKGDGPLSFTMGGRHIFAKSVTIPARPYLGVSAEDRDMIAEIFADHAARATGRR